MRRISVFCIFFCPLFVQLHAVVILVHGTFAYDVSWCKPGGDFYETLKKSAKKIGHKIVPFTWSGKLNDFARLQAAQSLLETLASYPATEKKILVGHSHGGNVINLVTQLLNNPVYHTLHNVFNTEPTQSKVDISALCNELGLVSSSDWFMKPDLFSIRIPIQSYAIDSVYLLATPVDEIVYAPCMNMVRQVFNLYSIGDYIQTVLGIYGRSYKSCERMMNLRVVIKETGIFKDNNPTHSQMHHELLAESLFDIPELVKKQSSNFMIALLEDGSLSIHPEKVNPLKGIQVD